MSALAPAHEEPPPPPPPPRRRARWGLRLLAALGVLLLLIAGFAAWLLLTAGGARFALDRALGMAGGGVRYENLEGSFRGPMQVGVVEVDRPDLYARVEGLEIDASPMDALRGSVRIHRLHARSVVLRTVDKGEPARMPERVAPPWPVLLEDGRVGELRVGALPPEAGEERDPEKRRALLAGAREGDLLVQDIRLRGSGTAREWKVDEARATTPFGSGRAAGTLQARPPFALDAVIGAEGSVDERPYRADVTAKGSLQSIDARFRAEVSGQPATGRAVLEPFSATTPVRALEVQAADVDLSRHLPDAPKTRMSLQASLAAAGPGTFAGPVRVENAQPGPWDEGAFPFESASARIVARADRIDVADLEVALRGGGFAGGRAALQRSGVEAELVVKAVDLAALHTGLQKTRMSGRIAATGDQAAQRFRVKLEDPRFALEGRGGLAGTRLTVETATVRTGGGAVTAAGHFEMSGSQPFSVEGRAEHFDPSAFAKTAKGDLNFRFAASGSAAARAGEVKLEIAPSRFSGLPVSGTAAASGDPRRVERADVDLAFGEARVQAKGSFGRAGDAMALTFRAPDLAALGRPFGVQVAGSAKGEARLTGTFASPAGRVAFTGANLVLPSNVFVREIDARVEAGVEAGSPIDGTVRASGVAIGEERPPTPLAQTLQATLKGTRAAHRLEASATMRRDTDVRAVLSGGLDSRAASPAWTGRLESLAMTGRGAFALADPATLAVSASRVELGPATLRGEWGEARLDVTRWTPRTLDLRGSTSGVQIQNLARSLRLGTVPRSNLVLAGDWDIRAAEQLDGDVNLRRVSGDLRVGEPPLALGLREMRFQLKSVASRLTASLSIEGERSGQVKGSASGRLARGASGWGFAEDAPLQAKLTAVHTQLESLTPWLGPDSRLGGQLNASIDVTGTGAEPHIAGTVRADNLVAREPQTGFELENGVVALRLDGRQLAIEEFSGTTPWRPTKAALERMRRVEAPAGGGRITGEGTIDLGARRGALRIRATQVPVTQIGTRFVAMSGEARLEAGEKGMLVAGGFKVDAGWIGAPEEAVPTVAEDVVVVRAKQAAPVQEEPPKEPIRLDLRFDLGNRLYFQGLGLDTRLAGDVHLGGTLGALRAKGMIRTVGGTFDGYGQKLTIERGVLTLDGPLDNPRLNVLALRKGLPVEAGVEVLGTLVRPRVRLVSVPDVPEPEKLSWLVLGRGAADASLGDSAVMMAAARALLGGSNPGSDLTKRLGFDEFKIGRSDANSVLGVLPQSTVAGRTGSPSAAEVVSVGRRINNAVNLTYEQGLADAEGALKLTWRISRRFQVLARAGYLPGLDAVYRWTFR